MLQKLNEFKSHSPERPHYIFIIKLFSFTTFELSEKKTEKKHSQPDNEKREFQFIQQQMLFRTGVVFVSVPKKAGELTRGKTVFTKNTKKVLC